MSTGLSEAEVKEHVRCALSALNANPSDFEVMPQDATTFEDALAVRVRRKDHPDTQVIITRAPFDDKNGPEIRRLLRPLV